MKNAEKFEGSLESSPIPVILEFLLQNVRTSNNTELTEQDITLIESWHKTLQDNFYTSALHLPDISAEEWTAMKIPLRLRSLGRIAVWNESNVTPSASNGERKRTKKTQSNTIASDLRRMSKGTLPDFKKFQDRKSSRKSTPDIIKTPSAEDLKGMKDHNPLKRDDSRSKLRLPEELSTEGTIGSFVVEKSTSIKKLSRSTSGKLHRLMDLSSSRSDIKEDFGPIPGKVAIAGDAASTSSLFNTLATLSNQSELDASVSQVRKHRPITKNSSNRLAFCLFRT
jgi:hypothetical protein